MHTPDFVIKGRGSGPSKTSHFRPPPWETPPNYRPQTPQALQDSLEDTPHRNETPHDSITTSGLSELSLRRRPSVIVVAVAGVAAARRRGG
eukprot:2470835-Pyramimonas_sp.AAC.1